MNKLLILGGMVFLGITSTPQSPETSTLQTREDLVPVTLKGAFNQDHWEQADFVFPECMETGSPVGLDLSSIAYEEMEDEVELGFDSREYLPENFDPYKSYVDLKAIPYLEEEGEEEFAVVTMKGLLPEGFNPYASPENFMDISYMEEEETDLGFDSRAWLPEGFDPYSKDLDLDSIVYIEEEDLELGFDTTLYLPDNFNPYSL